MDSRLEENLGVFAFLFAEKMHCTIFAHRYASAENAIMMCHNHLHARARNGAKFTLRTFKLVATAQAHEARASRDVHDACAHIIQLLVPCHYRNYAKM